MSAVAIPQDTHCLGLVEAYIGGPNDGWEPMGHLLIPDLSDVYAIDVTDDLRHPIVLDCIGGIQYACVQILVGTWDQLTRDLAALDSEDDDD